MSALGPLGAVRAGLRRLARDERANMSILFAAFATLGTVLAAFAVDEGALYLERRQMQSATDLAAIAAAQDPGNGFARARATLADAGLIPAGITDAALASGTGPISLTVETGAYRADPSLAIGRRFTAGASATNAARVEFRQTGTLYFARIWDAPPAIGVAALASTTPNVAFSIGSRLAGLEDGVANTVLNGLLGANVSLSAMSYQGLTNARVNLFSFLDALGQEIGVTAGTYDDLLQARADSGDIARALAEVLDGTDAAAAEVLGQALGHSGKLSLGKLVDLGPAARLALGTGAKAGYLANVSALEMLTASAALTDGSHIVSLGLGLGVPGLTRLDMSLAIGEPQQFAAWFGLGPSGTIVRTAQVRLKFVATLAGSGALLGIGLRLPLYLDVAYGEAGVARAACPAAGAKTGSATIDARPGIARLTVGEVKDADFTGFASDPPVAAAKLVDVPLLAVTASGVADIAAMAPAPLDFSAWEIEDGTVKTVSTTEVAQPLAASLLSHLTLGVDVGGLGIGLSTSKIKSLVSGLVTPLGPPLDATIATTLGALGLSLGSADVIVYGVNCGRAVLVG
jgi:uncharacterized membrane protein